MSVRTRFAPSPTGILHIGNARTALINWLFARYNKGTFILRIDDTDLERSKPEYEEAIVRDLSWLGLNWDEQYWQSKRLDKYEEAKNYLIQAGRLYECFETPEELEMKRKLLLSSGRPPIYDRSALKLTTDQKEIYKAQGRKPHYRFLLRDNLITWNDMVKGKLQYDPKSLSDPIVIREDGSMTYMICSTIDDIEFAISHVIRGEDHVTNTAIQIQMFEAFEAKAPEFGHLSLVKAKEDKISKRKGGFEIASLRDESGTEAMAINSFFALIGTSKPVTPFKNLQELTEEFNLSHFSTSPTTYLPEELERLNHKLLLQLSFEDIKSRLNEIGASQIKEAFWNAIQPNLQKLSDAKIWWDICYNFNKPDLSPTDKDFLQQAATLLPEGELNANSWKEWTNIIAEKTGRKGKELFMPLRLALTALEHGPELKELLILIGREEVIRRLSN